MTSKKLKNTSQLSCWIFLNSARVKSEGKYFSWGIRGGAPGKSRDSSLVILKNSFVYFVNSSSFLQFLVLYFRIYLFAMITFFFLSSSVLCLTKLNSLKYLTHLLYYDCFDCNFVETFTSNDCLIFL